MNNEDDEYVDTQNLEIDIESLIGEADYGRNRASGVFIETLPRNRASTRRRSPNEEIMEEVEKRKNRSKSEVGPTLGGTRLSTSITSTSTKRTETAGSVSEVKEILNENDIDLDALEQDYHADEDDANFEFDEQADELLDQILQDSEDLKYGKEIIDQKTQEIVEDVLDEHEKLPPLDRMEKKEQENARYTKKRVEQEFSFANFRSMRVLHSSVVRRLDKIGAKIFGGSGSSSYKDMGTITCIAADPKYLLIGFSHGVVGLYEEPHEREVKIFGGHKEQEYGKVTACDITQSHEALLVGYANGNIVFFDFKSGHAIKSITSLFNTPVLNVRFWKHGKSHSVASDNDGNIYVLILNKVMVTHTVDKKCLLSQAAGQISGVEPLWSNPFMPHALDDVTILAVASTTMVLLIMVEPTVKMLHKFERPQSVRDATAPTVSWGRGCLKDDLTTNDPLLCVSWGNVVQIIRCWSIDEGERGYSYAAHYVADNDILSLGWLSRDIFYTFDTKSELKLIFSGYMAKGRYHFDIEEPIGSNAEASWTLNGARPGQKYRGQPAIQNPVLNSKKYEMSLVYHTYLRDSNGRGRLCYHGTVKSSVSTRKVYLPGTTSFSTLNLLSWEESLNLAMKKGEWLSVLCLGVELYTGQYKGLADIPRDDHQRKIKMQPVLKMIIRGYIDNQLTNAQEPRHDQVEPVGIPRPAQIPPNDITIISIIEFCINTEITDFLFTDMYNKFCDADLREAFLEKLEPFILNEQIRKIPRNIFFTMVDYYRESDRVEIVERLILHLDLVGYETNQILQVCNEERLLSAYIYVHTKGECNDYRGPLIKMFDMFQQESNSRTQTEIGHKLMWYVRLCLLGRQFPSGMIPDKDWSVVILDIVDWLMTEEILKTLLYFDSKIYFECLAIVFEDGQQANIIDNQEPYNPKNPNAPKCPTHTEILDMLEDHREEEIETDFTVFIARISALGRIHVAKRICLSTAVSLLKKAVLEPEEHARKEKLIIQMLNACQELDFDDINELIRKAEFSSFAEVHILLLEHKREYVRCLESFIQSEFKLTKSKVFNWIDKILTRLHEEAEEDENMNAQATIERLKQEILRSLRELVEIDSELTADLVRRWFKNAHKEVINKLDLVPELQLEYLTNIIYKRDQEKAKVEKTPNDHPNKKETLEIENDLLILNVKLLCMIRPREVRRFLERYEYPLAECLALCEEYNIKDAQAYILERTGAVSPALDLVLQILDERFESLKRANKAKKSNISDKLFNIREVLRTAINLCKNNSDKLDKDESRDLWFRVLAHVVEERKIFFEESHAKISRILNEYVIKDILEPMMLYIDLRDILEEITEKYGNLAFKDLRETFMGILSNYAYQENILKSANNLLSHDIHMSSLKLTRLQSRGIKMKNERCPACHEVFQSRISEEIFLFYCGHAFHKHCLAQSYVKSCEICEEQRETLGMHIFDPPQRGKKKRQEPRRGSDNLDRLHRRSTLKLDPSDRYKRRLKIFKEKAKNGYRLREI